MSRLQQQMVGVTLSQREVDFLMGARSPLNIADRANLKQFLKEGTIQIVPPKGPSAALPDSSGTLKEQFVVA